MKEFWLSILKNVITYVLMLTIVIVGGISISTQKFPPDWAKIVSAINTIKDGYISMINLRQAIGNGGMQQGLQGLNNLQMPSPDEAVEQLAATEKKPSHDKKPKDADAEMQTTLAMIQAMSKQMTLPHQQNESGPVVSDPEMKKYLSSLIQQNQQLIDKMDKIQSYLEKMHVYLTQTSPRQPTHYSAVQQQPESRQIAAATPTAAVQPVAAAVRAQPVVQQPTSAPNQAPTQSQAQQNVKK